MRVLDARIGLMECTVCGRRHFAGSRGANGLNPASWQCLNGCCARSDNRRPPMIQSVEKNALELKIGPDQKIVNVKMQRIENVASSAPSK